ncbi:aminotransferase class III-fold pyridoxal phosphate-dependent enzyme [Citrobacter freundii]|uniref:aminotransferase class III-fold pyridoxal phosphate-dependent enzyme n=1 Tax=Citrobacter TaxID=544 RepID=UPI000659EA13|nr:MULTISPECIES: aminotransferase class III-fold pyridoxal phosphate-dependent enzyme [Citrobacter]QNM19916.1 aminotransferase class III-fold pyridoxal phosphate-dependent enzyme [Citrobacter freundii]QNM25374.1 aminotransferase class III-fold pyridoxal phosphate-dependent enzyme [Citrobacter freundii]QNM30068.1 aminotransferase class III-fold pyridoxal phosphate-dependent enzyme [Citrobacter freundii]QNM35303.1 aminotransferase class III-fold pyridoxal phosphate-dependent enzyme [Citrobacter f
MLNDGNKVSCYDYPHDLCATANGSHVMLTSGECVIDACCGLTGALLGYSHSTVIEAMHAQLSHGVTSLPGYLKCDAQDNALNSLKKISPKYIRKIHIKGSSGGSTSVEQGIKHMLAESSAEYILTLDVGHFGQTIATNMLSNDMRESESIIKTFSLKKITIITSGCNNCPFRKVPDTCSAECLSSELSRIDYLRTKENKRIAIFLFEPISGATGCHSWPHQFWHTLQEWCHNRGIYMIADESQTFGRLGGFFAVDYFGLEVDAICLAKGISGIGIPGCGALLLASDSASINRYQRSLTWGGSPISCAAIHSTIMEMSQDGFFEAASDAAIKLNELLLKIVEKNKDIFVCVKGLGFMLGLQLISSVVTAGLGIDLILEARRNGLYLRLCPLGAEDVIEFRPRVNISSQEIYEVIQRLTISIRSIKKNMDIYMNSANRPIKIHCIGIGGEGVGALGMFLSYMGIDVTGSDNNLSLVQKLNLSKANLTQVFDSHSPDNLLDRSAVIFGSAITYGNCELSTACRLGLELIPRAKLLGSISKSFAKCTAIVGTHGKSSTTIFFTQLIEELLGISAHTLLGGQCPQFEFMSYKPGLGIGAEWLIAEVTETDRDFGGFQADLILCPSLSWDHFDNFPTRKIYFDFYFNFFHLNQKTLP